MTANLDPYSISQNSCRVLQNSLRLSSCGLYISKMSKPAEKIPGFACDNKKITVYQNVNNFKMIKKINVNWNNICISLC